MQQPADTLPTGVMFDMADSVSSNWRFIGGEAAGQLTEESLAALLPDRWASANPDHALLHRIVESRRVANRKRDDRQKRP